MTYGVEIEATIAITRGEPIPGLEPGLPPPIQIPPNCGGTAATFEHIKREIQRVLKSHGLPTEAVAVNTNDTSPSQETLDAFSFFDVKDDWSIDTPEPYLASVEISTPVLADTARSSELLRYVVNLLTSSFLMIANPSCGLHVHVGQGEDGFTYDAVRRIASLLWAADPLLRMLHPPWRAVSAHCAGLRDFSRLARGGAEAEGEDEDEHQPPAHDDACHYLRGSVRYGERSPAWREAHPEAAAAFLRTREPGHFEPYHDSHDDDGQDATKPDQYDYGIGRDRPGRFFSPPASSASSSEAGADAPDLRQHPATQREIARRIAPLPRRVRAARARLVPLPRLRLARPSPAELRARAARMRPPVPLYEEDEFGRGGEASPTARDPGVYAGVRRLYEAPTSCAIAALLTDDATTRFNVHLASSYRCRGTRRPGLPRTFEFRGAEGSLDAGWVACWARICVGLVRFAAHAPVAPFLSVLRGCRDADDGGPYDIIDLLCQVGLLDEAHIAARRLRENAGRWELEFVDEKEPAPVGVGEPVIDDAQGSS